MKSLHAIVLDNQRADVVKAGRLVLAQGQRLIGKEIDTPRLGDYPGGVAVVTEIAPDPAAPDICLNSAASDIRGVRSLQVRTRATRLRKEGSYVGSN